MYLLTGHFAEISKRSGLPSSVICSLTGGISHMIASRPVQNTSARNPVAVLTCRAIRDKLGSGK
jgi:hypothetical protein